MIKPKHSIRPRKPHPNLELALEQRELQRPRTIRERAQEIHTRVHQLRAVTYLLTLPNRRF